MVDLDTANWQKALKKAFEELMFLTEDEINNIMKELEDMPEAAYKEIFMVVQEGKAKQNDVLEKIIKKNPDFVKDLKKELEKALKVGAIKIEEKEAENAEVAISDKLKKI